MGKIIFVFAVFLLVGLTAVSQTIRYDKVNKSGNYKTYISKEGDTLKIGQNLILGIPTGDEGFRFVTQGNLPVANWLSGKEITIKELKVVGKKRQGYKMYVLFKGYGLLPVYIDYEIARQTNEVLAPD